MAAPAKVTGGGNLGVFGPKAAEDIPFNIRSYNEALILNQQPDSLGEVLDNDPTVRTALGFDLASDSAFGSRLLQGGPRTFKASASIEF